ncbi:drkC [Scenedesmus sp. PABB004]|nr:drkC [Scenedesmus sp. PABB004]
MIEEQRQPVALGPAAAARLTCDQAHGKLDIAIADDGGAGTVIHVRGPAVGRMSDLGYVFDKLGERGRAQAYRAPSAPPPGAPPPGAPPSAPRRRAAAGVDIISCSTMPTPGSCDMTLVVVDRHDSQPLDDCLKQSVRQGLRSVLQGCSGEGCCEHAGSPPRAGGCAVPPPTPVAAPAAAAAEQQQQQQEQQLPPLGAARQSSGGGFATADSSKQPLLLDLCRAGSSEAAGKAVGWQPSQAGAAAAAQQQQLEQLQGSGSRQPTPRVTFADQAGAGEGGSRASDNPCGFRPALKIDIPFVAGDAAGPAPGCPERTGGQRAGGAASGSGAAAPAPPQQQSRQQPQPQQPALQASDLAQRLLQLGLRQRPPVAASSDSDSDGGEQQSDHSGQLSARRCRWLGPLPSRSCNDLAALAQLAAPSDEPPSGASTRRSPQGAVAAEVVAAAQRLPTSVAAGGPERSSRSDESLHLGGGPERSSRSDNSMHRAHATLGALLHSINDAAARAAGDRAVPPSPAVHGGGGGGGGGGGTRRKPPARTPSRIILSPVAPDGSGDPGGAPKLFVSIPKEKAPSDEKRARRPVKRATTCGTLLTPGRGGVLSALWSQQSVGRLTSGGASPKAAAAAAAAAGMPYNVAVAAAQLLGSHGNAREAAAAVAAAAAASEQAAAAQQAGPPSASPLSSPLPAPASAASSAEVLTSPAVATPRGVPPLTPVHPAVAAAAAAAIAVAAEAAGEAAAAMSAAMSAAGVIEEGDAEGELSSLVSTASGASGDAALLLRADADADGGESSSSEEWWCGSLTGLVARDIMSGPLRVVPADTDVAAARAALVSQALPGLLVDLGPGEEPGFLTRRDFFKASSFSKRSARRRARMTVRDIMSHPAVAVESGQAIELCAAVMQEAGVQRAVVRDAAAGAAAPGDHLAGYVGLLSDAAIFRCLGLYPDDDAPPDGDDDERAGAAGLPPAARHASLAARSSADGSGLDTPLSSRAATPGGGGGGALAPSASAPPGGAPALAGSPKALTLPDLVLMREGVRLGSSLSSSSAGSMGSLAAGVMARAGSGGAPGADGGAGSAAGTGSSAGGTGGSAAGGAPDALSRYRTAASLWEVDMREMELLRRIGEGSFGEVMLANYRGTKVAVKRLRVLDIDDAPAPGSGGGSSGASSSAGGSRGAGGGSQAAFRQFFEREIAILASIRHPNVVNFIGACHTPGQRCLVTEYCARGSLDQVLHKSGLALDLPKRVEFAMDVARGMACLHAQRPIIIHRDLKTANLLVSARFEVKVADFGLSRIKDASHLQVSRAGLEGTIEYCAPEVLRGEPYTERCDVYSFGVVLWELLTRARPYSDADVPVFLLMVNIGNGSLALPDLPPDAATPGLRALTARCLAFAAADRPEFREVLAALEAEYRALRAAQPRAGSGASSARGAGAPPLVAQQAPQQAGGGGVPRCDSASSMGVHASPRVAAGSPDTQSPAGSAGHGSGTGHAEAAAYAAAVQQHEALLMQQQQQQQQQFYGQQAVLAFAPQQLAQQQQGQAGRHRLSQADSLSSCGGGAPLLGVPLGVLLEQQQLYQQPYQQQQFQQHQQHHQQQQQQFQQEQQQLLPQHMLSMPLPQLLIPHQHGLAAGMSCGMSSTLSSGAPSGFNSPRASQQLAAAGAFLQGAGSGGSSGGGSGGSGVSGPASQAARARPGAGAAGAAPHGRGAAPGAATSSKPPRQRGGLSRARSLPVPQSISWPLEEGGGEDEDDGGGLADALGAEDSFTCSSSDFGGGPQPQLRCVSAYTPCASGPLCMVLDPAASGGVSSGLPQLYYAAPQQVLLTSQGQQVPVVVAQPGSFVQYAPQAHFTAAPGEGQAQGQQQQQQPQQQQFFAAQQPQYVVLQQQQPAPAAQQLPPARALQRGLFTPSPTPGGLATPPLSSSPSLGLNPLAVMAAAGAAAAAARREGSASGTASPSHAHAGGFSLHRRSSSQGGSRGVPPLQLLQLGDPGSPTPLSARGGADSGCSTPMLGGGGPVAPALLLQRLDSLNRSGSASPRSGSVHVLPSPVLHSEGSGQLVGVFVGVVPGPPSGGGSPLGAPLAPGGGHSGAHRHASSRLAIQGSYELPPGGQLGAAPAPAGSGAYSSGAPGDAAAGYPPPPPHLQPNRRPPSLLRIDSRDRDRSVSPFAVAAHGDGGGQLGAAAPAGVGRSPFAAAAGSAPSPFAPAAHAGSSGGARTASPFAAASGAPSRTASPFAAASGAPSRTASPFVAASGAPSRTASPFAAASGAGSAALSPFAAAASAGADAASSMGASDAAGGSSAPRCAAASPFAAAAAAAGEADQDTGAVADASPRQELPERGASAGGGRGSKPGASGVDRCCAAHRLRPRCNWSSPADRANPGRQAARAMQQQLAARGRAAAAAAPAARRGRGARPRCGVVPLASICARWTLDARYGQKAEATALLQEWVARIGSQAGLTPQNTRLSGGCLGAPESRLEMEVTLDSLAAWEAFLAALPMDEHRAWGQRLAGVVVDGSPAWVVHRTIPVLPPQGAAAGRVVAAGAAAGAAPVAPPRLVITDQVGLEDIAAWQQQLAQAPQQQPAPPEAPSEAGEPPAKRDAADLPLDWKGEPMRISPGDKLPFKFLAAALRRRALAAAGRRLLARCGSVGAIPAAVAAPRAMATAEAALGSLAAADAALADLVAGLGGAGAGGSDVPAAGKAAEFMDAVAGVQRFLSDFGAAPPRSRQAALERDVAALERELARATALLRKTDFYVQQWHSKCQELRTKHEAALTDQVGAAAAPVARPE